tara:strand:- start:13881 stop:14180 length:300 start_codon:yes stop_codon:yes gene_type:complete
MKKLIIYFLFLAILSSCQAAREGFTLKKKDNSDEFLVEKKNPLTMPPSYENLPTPEDFQIKENKNEEEFENIFNNKIETSTIIKTKKTSIEKSVIDKIN